MITHPEKLLFSDDGITKGELASYYEAIAPAMVPHIRSRPITMERYPSGIDKKGFWQKDVSKGFPEWLGRGGGAQEGRHGAPSAGHRCAIAAVGDQSEHRHSACMDVARTESVLPRRLRL